MENVVLLVRVSTEKQYYERQVIELTEYCKKVGWNIKKIFSNKISGFKKNNERIEIISLIEYVKSNNINKVVCLEISRLGRNTLESLKVINTLNEHKVSLYVKNYNLETLNPNGTINPVVSLICTILLEISSMERLTIKERMESGRNQYIKNCRQNGIKMGRPSTYRKSIDTYKTEYQKEIHLLRKGISLNNVSSLSGTSINTLRKIKSLGLV